MDRYAVQVYDENGYYAYGFFDNLSDMKLLCSKNAKYSFTVDMIPAEEKRIPLVAQNVTFPRNKLTSLEFTVKEVESANTFQISANEELVKGETISLDEIDDLVDTEVNPEISLLYVFGCEIS